MFWKQGKCISVKGYDVLESQPVWGTASRSTYLKFRVYRRLLAISLSLFYILSLFLSLLPCFLIVFLFPHFPFLLPPQVSWLKISQLSWQSQKSSPDLCFCFHSLCCSCYAKIFHSSNKVCHYFLGIFVREIVRLLAFTKLILIIACMFLCSMGQQIAYKEGKIGSILIQLNIHLLNAIEHKPLLQVLLKVQKKKEKKNLTGKNQRGLILLSTLFYL